jgi:hypothetical protein
MVIDAFHFFNEQEIVDLRFKTLNKYTDTFCIIEANISHQGECKGYNFPYEKYHQLYGDKIKYFQIELKEDTPWKREHENRAAIFKCLQTLNPQDDDLVFFSDCDEIWNSDILNNNKIKNIKSPIGLMQMNFIFNKNLWANTVTVGTIVAKYLNLKNLNEWQGDGLNFLRDKRNLIPRINDGGVHLSYYGDINTIVQKCSAIAEGNLDYNTEDGRQKILQYIIDAQNGRSFPFAPYGVQFISDLEFDKKEFEYWTVVQNQWIKEKNTFKIRI